MFLEKLVIYYDHKMRPTHKEIDVHVFKHRRKFVRFICSQRNASYIGKTGFVFEICSSKSESF